LIKSFVETQSIADHLAYILPDMPWDTNKAYSPDTVDCYVATPTGGVAKIGKKLALLKILESGKVEIVDGVLRLYVVPKAEADAWIKDFKILVEREKQRGL
jgi:Cns1/TTC4 Wheel domain